MDSPLFDWTVSAIDTLELHHPHVKSPYLWSFTTIYSAGKHVWPTTHGRMSPSAKQVGGMAALRRMTETRRIDLATPVAPVDPGVFMRTRRAD